MMESLTRQGCPQNATTWLTPRVERRDSQLSSALMRMNT